MEITGWTVKASGEVCFSIKDIGTENYIKELYAIAKARLDEQKATNKIQDYVLKITI